MEESKNKKILDSFVAFCKQYPEQRFWQALRNWSKYDFIYGAKYSEEVDDVVLEDTFYKEQICK